jgi:hypothetical protein
MTTRTEIFVGGRDPRSSAKRSDLFWAGRQRQAGASRGRDLFGKLAIVEGGLAEAHFTERGLWIDRCGAKRTRTFAVKDRCRFLQRPSRREFS